MEFIALLSQDLAFLFIEVAKVFLSHRLALFVGRNDDHAHLRKLQDEPLLLGLIGQLVDDFSSDSLERLVNLALFGPIIIAVKHLRNLRLKGLHKIMHVLLQLLATARRNHNPFGLIRLLEVVDITPIGRGGFLLGLFLDEGLGGIRETGLGWAGDENIVSVLLHTHAELDGIDGPFLPDNSLLPVFQ